jgi:hypothetical protein
MTLYNRYEEQYRRLCPLSRTFAQIADQSIFGKISEQTTQEQFAKAQQSLLELCQRLEAQVDLFHYPAAYGQPHSCVRDLYLHAAAHLENLAIMHVPVQPAAPKQQLITTEGVVIDLEGKIQTNTDETDVGTADSSTS